MATPMLPATLISSLPTLLVFLSSIRPSHTLYLDLEGKKLSRNGTISLITVFVHPTRATSLIDVQTLGKPAFTTSSANGKTLKAILEDPHTPKCLWDVRNDADALWAHYQVRLAGVTDVQLLENASRAGDKTYARGLDKCVEKDLGLKFMEVHRWIRTKKEVQALFPNDIFARRPMDAKTMQYCVNDVIYLPQLRDIYTKRIDGQWMEKAMIESARRVVTACGPAYEPHSEMKKLGPWGTGLDRGLLTMDEWLNKWGEDRMDAMQLDMLGGDSDNDFDGDFNDDDCGNSRDASWDDTFDSCWEK
ncbi:ribonuclease H-like domain-containing protein [Whalleya microplaca]|nr:ribonuclease H-like domain-containing protein [Whalleya microplaca]